MTGKEGQPYYAILNNKVLEYIGDPNEAIFKFIKPYAGKHHELLLGKLMYDPKYGCPEKIEDWTAEARAAREHGQIDALEAQGKEWWKCIGRCSMFEYELKEEFIEEDKALIDQVVGSFD